MKTIELYVSEETFERLQKHAKPLVDTPDAVINRALDALEGEKPRPHPMERLKEVPIDPQLLPRLTHTKVVYAEVDGTDINRPNWNRLVDEMLRVAMNRLGSFENLRNLCPANLVKGKKENEGFAYLDDIGLSVQRQDANSACRTIVSLAQRLGVGIDIGFMWRHKEDALKPGQHARIHIVAAKTT